MLATPRCAWQHPRQRRTSCDAGDVTTPRSVLVVDDQAPFRSAAKAVLRRLEGFELVGEASSGAEAIELVDELHPALVLMDINMPEMSGIEATRQIIVRPPRCGRDPVLDLRRERPAPGRRGQRRPRLREQGTARADTLRRLWEERDSGTFVLRLIAGPAARPDETGG